MKKIGIVSLRDDLHVTAVTHLAAQRGYSVVHICADDITRNSFTVRISPSEDCESIVTDQMTGIGHGLGEFGVIWWRRSSAPQLFFDKSHDDFTRKIVNKSIAAQIAGTFNRFAGLKIVNSPIHAAEAENKIVQLIAAKNAGLSIPKTLFSNNPREIRGFYKGCNENIIVKSHYSSADMPITTLQVTAEMLENGASLAMSPAIYQEYIVGQRHLRVLVAGDTYAACQTLSHEVDSRLDLSVPIQPVQLGQDVLQKLRTCLAALNIEMGVFDLKISDENELVFLEVNQQGQFAYLDAVSGLNSLEIITDFLIGKMT